MTTIDVRHIARLASLPISIEDEKKFASQLEAVLSHIDSLSEVDVRDVAETSQVTGLENVERADKAIPSLSQEAAVSSSKDVYNNLFVVPVLIEEAIEE